VYLPDALAAAVSQELGSLIEEYGFVQGESSAEAVRFESSAAALTVTAYAGDHGQVDVIVEPAAPSDAHERLVISRTVGRASLTRVLQLAARDLQANEQALRGDSSFFRQLAVENRRLVRSLDGVLHRERAAAYGQAPAVAQGTVRPEQ